MAKYCGNCGAMMHDTARVCGYCGKLLDTRAGYSDPPPAADPVKKLKLNKRIKTIIALLVAAAVLAAALGIVFNTTGSRGLARKVAATYKSYEIDQLIDLSSTMYNYLDYEDPEVFLENYYKDTVGHTLDLIENDLGSNYKLTYQIDDIYSLSKRQFDNEINAIENRYKDFDTESIKKINVAKIILTAKHGKDSRKEYISVKMALESGSWKLMSIEPEKP